MTIVVKIGGAAGNESAGVLDEVARRSTEMILVHGGSEEADRLGARLGQPSRYYTSPSGVVSRYTDEAHMEVVTLALAGAVQTRLVRELAIRGVRAVGLSGVDGGLVLARRKEGARALEGGRTIRLPDDRAGAIESIHVDLIERVRAGGYVPVIGPPAVTAAGEIVNVDADRVAAHVARAVHAEALLLLTNVGGLRRDADDPSSIIPRVDAAHEAEALSAAKGRMHKKVRAALDAVAGGVHPAIIATSSGAEPIARALAGEGTVFG